jgi:CTP:molybdopterin cytidylyltransferase MocA
VSAAGVSVARVRAAGVVPAAGASRRMGEPKGLLELEGETFVRRVVRALAEGGCAPVVVVVAEGDERVRTEALAAGARVLVNARPGEGPITSLRLALAALRGETDGIAYLPLDHPLVRPETVSRLLERGAPSAGASGGASLVIPTYGSRRGHPTLFGAALFDELSDPALEGGARTVVHRHLAEAVLVEVDDVGVLTDVDTRAEYEALTAETRRGPGPEAPEPSRRSRRATAGPASTSSASPARTRHGAVDDA